jgi:L-lactate dehydrogenase complex protein LldE
MTVQLMLTCLCDALYGEVGIAAVDVLEKLGVEVRFPENQTCCGQPAFNAGDVSTALIGREHFIHTFDPALPVVVLSGSCTAMLRHGFALAQRPLENFAIYELSEYLLDVYELKALPKLQSRNRLRVAFHASCHSRAIHLGDRPQRLLSMIPWLEWAPFLEPEQCCGFGGVFSATHPATSAGIGDRKLAQILSARPDAVASGDMGCLMHLSALARSQEQPWRAVHYVQLLAEALQ